MAAAFEDAARETSPGSLPMLLARELVDLLVAGARMRRGVLRHSPLGPPERKRSPMKTVAGDVAHAIRMWRKAPAFAVVAVATLALGVGAATAIWTLADGVLFRPLPHERPEALVMVSGTSTEFENARLPLSWPNYVDLREAEGTGMEDLAAFAGPSSATVLLDDVPESLRAIHITANGFELLGNRALLGRALVPRDGESDAPPVVVVSESLWRTRFGASPQAIGALLDVGGTPHEIIGVMPAAFSFPTARIDLWLPLQATDAIPDRDTNYLQVIGRLAAGTSSATASARLGVVMDRLVDAYPADNAGKGIRLTPRRDVVIGDARPVMLMLLGAAGLLLLLACANLANLMLARGVVRGRELAVRTALGAHRGRLIGQLVTETLVLAVAGGLSGAVVARALVGALLAIAPTTLPRASEIALDGRALLFAALATLLCGLLFGLLPAWRTVTGDIAATLREGGRGTGAGGRQRGLRGLVVAQLALALVLVSGGALLTFSFQRLVAVDPGFDASGVYVFRVAPPSGRYEDPARVHAFYDALLGEVEAIPGVISVGATWALPFANDFASGRVSVEGRPLPAGQEPFLGIVPVRGDYFETLRLPLVTGRMLAPTDDADAPPVVLINQAAARSLWPGEDAVGKRFRRGRAEETDLPWITVVGVVGDVKQSDLAAETRPEMYWTHAQAGSWARDLNVVVRARDAAALAPAVRRAVSRVDPLLPITRSGLLADRISASVAEPRFRAILLAAFSLLALLLAAVGTYGVMAFVVAQRRREIGLRMALGADRGRVQRDVMGEGLRLTATAVVVGVAFALAGARLLRGLLFDVQPLDPRVHAAAVAVLVTSALIACWLPALRASRVDPLRTLKEE